ncbi:ABC1 kinase family protein [Haloferax volcanii]|uniref:UbiB family protein n=3 Tax=Haloferax volcanii TaxID=2246 RepID=D4GWH1_HALVD|nr:AarF/ABC1/UbiB kinase family protein [Haloferax volcanii]ADE03541.1 UbiB family protein [Haloferax volcanii DS2]ELY33097.1 putative ubiquinone biosynthesis transmembrane protein [Haloferax volcanii DS2]MBS8120591.1 AarF/ABC1/UbiB kinase family protein [Haloferax volcanii]MBS8125628.1 AarF/ABC1/UbiB kinase family protein [Haloferax volcanii]MBS8129637.1 AarF/ABC1/UbiB kinase family protein [Haloferax volcanii]
MVTLVNLRAYWRFLVVLYQFFPLIVAYTRDKRKYLLFGGGRRVTTEMRVERADVLLESLLTLGPTFIKLGQLLSTRPDILPPEYIEVLGSLQDDVPAAPWDESKAVLEAELGPVEEAFDAFDSDPISGASLGQVYVAEYEGEKVAVKVRRPGIEDLVEADLRVIRWSMPLLMRFIGEGRAFSLENLADEFAKTIREEMDYAEEAETLVEIQENFADDDTLVIPEPIPERSGDRVLTMEYLPGTKINDIDALDDRGIDRTELATNLQRIYLQMIVDDGVFHADPHPGNLSVTDDGRIIFYDFGMHGEVDPFIQEKIVEFYIAVANQDVDGILDTLIEMGTLSPNVDRQVMGDVMELAIADARGDDIEQYRVNQILEQVESTIYEFPLRLPRNLALVLRVAGVVEGVCVTLDPEFDFISVATDYLTEEGYREESVQKIIEGVGQQGQKTAQSLFRVPPKLERVLDRADRDNLTLNVRLEDNRGVLDKLAKRLIYGIFLSFGFVSTVIIYALNPESLVAVGAAGAPTAVVALLLWRSFRSRRGIRTTPQFTRQNLKERRRE